MPPPSFLPVAVPCTVLACETQGGLIPDLLTDLNIYAVNATRYDEPWVFVTTFDLPAAAVEGNATVALSFLGINYRARAYVNGALVADNSTLVGAFARARVDATAAVAAGRNGVAVVITRPTDHGLDATPNETDLAITFVDWAPQPPDSSMGLWSPVVLEALPSAVSVDAPLVSAAVDAARGAATVALGATLRNAGAAAADVALRALLVAPDGRRWTAAGAFTVPARGELLAVLPNVTLLDAQLWWPFELTGAAPALHALTLTAAVGGVDVDAVAKRVGVREARGALVAGGVRGLAVNGVPVLVRGAGWAPDLLLRESAARTRAELEYVRDMGLNAVRLEGKMMQDFSFDIADELGIMVLPGWCCCDAWQHWPAWTPAINDVARRSMQAQARRLRAAASVVAFFISRRRGGRSPRFPPRRTARARARARRA